MRNGLSVIALVALIIAILRLLTLSVAPPLKTAAVRQSSRSQPAVIDGAEARFRSRFDYIRPGGQEIGWQKIRWRLRLWGGVAEAQRRDKPILFWMMNGHPLGFT